MPSKKIGLIFDCDGTIAEDSTTRLLRHIRCKVGPFWERVQKMEKQGWEPTLAFMKLLADFSKEKRFIMKETFREVGKKLKLSAGIPGFFTEIRQYVSRKYSSHGISLGIYIVSGGIDEIIKASRINGKRKGVEFVDGIFAGRFAYNNKGSITFPQWAVSFTEKTKCIYAINKGISSERLARDSYSVNDHVPQHEREVLMNNLIYIGDGPTDVPCMSLLKSVGCEIFAVYTAPRQGIPKVTHNLARQGRFTRGPYKRDYRRGSDLRRALESELDGYAERIIGEAAATRRPAVRH